MSGRRVSAWVVVAVAAVAPRVLLGLRKFAKKSGTSVFVASSGCWSNKAIASRVAFCLTSLLLCCLVVGGFLIFSVSADTCSFFSFSSLIPTSSARRLYIKSLKTLSGIVASKGLAVFASFALPSMDFVSISFNRLSNRNSDSGTAFLSRISNASFPSLRTMESGSSPSGKKRNLASRPSRSIGKVFSRARHAALCPA